MGAQSRRGSFTVVWVTLLVVGFTHSAVGATSGVTDEWGTQPQVSSNSPGFGSPPKLDSSRLGPGVAEALESGGTLTVAVHAADARVEEALDAIARTGGRLEASLGTVFKVRIPSRAVEALASAPGVGFVDLPARPVQASVVSEGGLPSNAAEWTGTGLTGRGVKVAVLDSGFAGYTDLQASGELPPALTTANYGCSSFEGGSHGSAVAEIIHDVAPDVQMYLVCISDLFDMDAAVDYLIQSGVNVINFSQEFYGTERGDGSGDPYTPSAVARRATDSGILWVSAAGNDGQRHWGGSFLDTDSDGWHEFDPGDENLQVSIPPGYTMKAILKWDDWPATSEDFDLYALDSSGIVDYSETVQDGSQPPVEMVSVTNWSSYQMRFIDLYIYKFSAATVPRFDLVVWGSSQIESPIPSRSVGEPAGSPDVLTVAASCWSSEHNQPYSSRGPNIAGDPKPDVSGFDAVSTAIFGSSGSCDSGFTGTSAAAPLVAGAAAQLLQANPSMSPAQVKSWFANHAVDKGRTGFDNAYGWGNLFLGSSPAPLCAGRPATILGTPLGDRLDGTSGDDVIHGWGGDDRIYGGGGNDLICGGDGNDLIYGQADADELHGGAGADFIKGHLGDDAIFGDGGPDRLEGGRGDDILSGGSEADVIYGRPGNDIISGDGGDDTIFGGTGRDVIAGGLGADVIDGGNQADQIDGGDGADLILAGANPDIVDGGAGNDEIHGGPGSDQMWGSDGSDLIFGDEDDDVLHGGAGKDVLDGGDGSDELHGDQRDDRLIGGPGDDSLFGNGGDDFLGGGKGADYCDGGVGVDTASSCQLAVNIE